MGFDVRLPLGAFFSLVGAVLVVYGVIAPREIYQRSLDLNVNLLWGAVLLAFGALMLFLARRARR